MIHPTNEAYWRDLESNAHLPDVQELIRQKILSGMIRVRPKRGGGIRICRLVSRTGKNRSKLSPRPPRRRKRRDHPGKWV